jgi:uncharacterized OsmC-like protein
MEVTIEHLGRTKFEAMARGHRVICDQPQDNDGDDTGMTPPELLLTSLGSCMAFYAVQYLRTRNLPQEGVSVKVSAEKAKSPARLGSFRVEVTVPPLEERHREGIRRCVDACLIHNTLLNAPSIETVILSEAAIPLP